jgi:Protein of unknown function (DUF992)
MGGRLPVLLTATLSLMVTPAMSEPKTWSQVGALNCTMGPSIGLVMGSRQKARCVFEPAATNAREVYTGRMELEGADLGIVTGGKFSWMVVAETKSLPAKSLVGRYVGAAEEIILDGNDGGSALCSGLKRSICLRPVTGASQGNENLAFGTSALRLQ